MKFFSQQPDSPEIAGTKLAGRVGFGILAGLAAVLGTMTGLLIVYSTDLPQISELAVSYTHLTLPTILRV